MKSLIDIRLLRLVVLNQSNHAIELRLLSEANDLAVLNRDSLARLTAGNSRKRSMRGITTTNTNA